MRLIILFLISLLFLTVGYRNLYAQSTINFEIKKDSLYDEANDIQVIYETISIKPGTKPLVRNVMTLALWGAGLTDNNANAILNSLRSYKKEREDPGAFIGSGYYHTRSLDYIGTYHNYFQIRATTTAYLGGVHENAQQQYFRFSTLSGQFVGWEKIVKPGAVAQLTQYAESAFRKNYSLEATDALDAKGHFFPPLTTSQYPFGAVPDNAFRLSKGFYFTQDALVLAYDRYEISPYTMLPPSIELPLDEVKPYLNLN